MKKIVVAILVLLLLVFAAFCWIKGGAAKKEFSYEKNVALVIPVALRGTYLAEHSGENGELCDLSENDLVPCVEKLAPTNEIKNACLTGEEAMQKYRDKILSSPDFLVGLAVVSVGGDFSASPIVKTLEVGWGNAEFRGSPPALVGIDLIGLNPAFSEAVDGLNTCLEKLGSYHK